MKCLFWTKITIVFIFIIFLQDKRSLSNWFTRLPMDYTQTLVKTKARSFHTTSKLFRWVIQPKSIWSEEANSLMHWWSLTRNAENFLNKVTYTLSKPEQIWSMQDTDTQHVVLLINTSLSLPDASVMEILARFTMWTQINGMIYLDLTQRDTITAAVFLKTHHFLYSVVLIMTTDPM